MDTYKITPEMVKALLNREYGTDEEVEAAYQERKRKRDREKLIWKLTHEKEEKEMVKHRLSKDPVTNRFHLEIFDELDGWTRTEYSTDGKRKRDYRKLLQDNNFGHPDPKLLAKLPN